LSSSPGITIDLGSEVPIYQQIAREILRLVSQGVLVVGDPLPSVRQLGADIGVNLNTVARAYRQLAEVGVVELRHGAVATVAAPPARRVDASEIEKLDDLIGLWALHGADQKTIAKVLDDALDRRFGKRR